MNKFLPYIFFMMTLLLAGMGEVHAQNTPAPGTEISNQASVSYSIPGAGELTQASNEVKVIVSDLTSIDFYPNNSTRDFRGRTVQFNHYLSNRGNLPTTVDVIGFNSENDDFDLQNLQWENIELSKAALPALGDTIRTTITINPGEQYLLTYSGQISQLEERRIQTAIVEFEARSRESGLTLQNSDSVSILVGAIVDIQKEQMGIGSELAPGDDFTYHITGQNTGDLTAEPTTITLDNSQMEKVVMLDSIPANLTFTGFGTTDNGTPVYHIAGNDKYEFTSNPPADQNMVDVIAVLFDSLQVGETFSTEFNVRVSDNASGQILNVAEITFIDPEGSVTTAAASNQVVATVEGASATIDYFTNNNFNTSTGTSTIGEPLYIQASASACNEDRSVIESVEIELTSSLTGDMENFVGIETGVNSGVFRIETPVPTRDGSEFDVVSGNMILETVEDDIITALLNCNGLQGGSGGPRIQAEVGVDPFGIVFDSETNEVVEGAEIRVYDVTGANNGGNPGGLATIFTANGVNEWSSTQNSNSLGKFRFPFLLPGSYRIEVIPPNGYEFNSQVRGNNLPQDRKVDSLASYGMEFEVTGQASALDFDIPVDPLAQGVLLAQKEVDQRVADIGDYVNYTITLKSEAVNTVQNLTLYDQLPFGFKYQPGTARLDGSAVADPVGGVGPDLEFDLGDIDPGEKKILTYRVYLGPGSDRGDGTNTAMVRSDEVIVKTSNNAKVKINVRGGVFSDEAIIVGRVFMDCNENNMQDPSEAGIPGVRLYLENGNYVITDANGMYTMYAIKPNKHVLKIDNHSLPEGSKIKVLDNRHAFDPSSRFVDVKKGEMQRADFAVCECSPGVKEQIEERKALLAEKYTNDLDASLKQNFSVTEQQRGGGNTIQASGTVGNVKAPSIPASTPGETMTQQNEEVQSDSLEVISYSIEDAIRDADQGTEIINIIDGDTLSASKLTVWAKGASGAAFDLFINGEIIANDRIGQRSVLQEKRLQIWEYVGITLKPGKNVIELVEADPFGNVRGQDKKVVYTAGELNQIKVYVPRNNVSADGISTALVKLELLDKDGIQVGSRMPVTLDASFGTWKVEDLDKEKPGTQIFIEGGVAEFELKSTIEPNTSKIRASVGTMSGEAIVEFLPDLRPLIAAGIIEGTLRLRDPLNITPAADNDGFERELKQLSYNFNSFTADARFAFFLKGKVSGKTLLTAGFDSEKSEEERLFRDIRPEEYYPVYGESSVKGFDAQSSGRLYLRLDRGKTYALYGDFVTMDNDADIQISGYSRAQNGLKTHFEQGDLAVEAFGVSSVSSRRIREFQAQGISRYELPDNDLIDNSEIIELITYDRNQPDVILSTERLTRFTDYVIDPFSGVITFKQPVFSVDQDFNPVFIRATYEVENDDERYLIGGVRGNYQLMEGLEVGAGILQDNNPQNNFTMASGNAQYEIGDNTRVIAEVAQTNTDESGSGQAVRVEVQHKGQKYDVRAQFGKSSENFDNKGASLGQAKTEARARGRFSLTNKTNLSAEFLLTRNDTTGDQTMGGLVSLQQNFKDVNAEVGVRYSDQTSSTGDVKNTNVRTKVTTKLPFVTGASAFGEYEQDITAADRKTIAVGGDYKVRDIAKVYAKHEFISSAGGRYTLQSNAQRNNTVFGVDANYMKNGKVFSEYRLADAMDGRTGQASIGLRNRFMLREGLGLNAGFERIFTVQGPNNNDGTAISASVDYTGSARWKGSARAEARLGVNTDTYLNSLGYGLKINRDWTFLGRNIIAITSQDGKSGIQKIQQRLQLGAAFRDAETNTFDALFRYEFKYEKDQNVAPEYYKAAHVFSSHANYHPFSDLYFSGRVAAKYSLSQDELTRNTSFLELVAGRMIYDLNDSWDAGINASLLANSDFTTKDYGLGIELGYLVATNLRLATGFNFFGYEDEDLAANNYTQPGVYLGFSYKFDEQVFRDLAPRRMNHLIDESVYQQCVPCQKSIELAIMPVVIPEHTLEPLAISGARPLEYRPITRRTVLPRQIHFANDRSYINRTSAQMLDKLAKFLFERDTYVINISGFTDSKQSAEYNFALSRRRVDAVRAYLISAGVDDEKLKFVGFGELEAGGTTIVDMALERYVEVELSEIDDQVTFIDQIEDLQVNIRRRGIGAWDYIFRSEHNAVPSNLNLISGTSELTYLNKYLIERIAVAMEQYPDISVTIKLPNDQRYNALQNSILNQLSALNANVTQFMFVRGGTNSTDEINFEYQKANLLRIFEQNDDVKFRGRQDIHELTVSLLELLRSREDYDLLHDFSQSYVVPDRITINSFINGQLSNESQAVTSRIGSYLVNYRGSYIELRGDGSARDQHRMEVIRDYMIEWGIEASRIVIGVDTADTNGEFIKVEYKRADAINLLNIGNVEFLNVSEG